MNLLLLLCACCLAAPISELPPLTARAPLALVAVTPSAASVGRGQRFTLAVALTATYDNPFDPDQIDLSATFTAPNGRALTVPGFYSQPYRPLGAATDDAAPLLPRQSITRRPSRAQRSRH